MSGQPLQKSAIGEWVRFISSALLIPAVVAGVVFATRVERFMSAMEERIDTMVTHSEFEARMALKADRAEVPPPEVKNALADLRAGQVDLSAQIAQLRRDVIEYIVKRPAR